MTTADLQIELEAPPAQLALDGVALFLDLDGTLATIVERPEDVRPDARRTGVIERLLSALDGRLAVVSGRSLEDIDHILEGKVTTVAAIHGLIRRDARGVVGQAAPHPGLIDAAARLKAFAPKDSGVLIEDKGLSLALHFRRAPHLAREAGDLTQQIAADTGLALQPGDMVIELRTPGASKGDSIRAFMTEPPFAGAMPVFMGDDLTDEHGFFAVRALGGYGVLVGPERRTLARYVLPDVEAALTWLEAAR